MLGSFKRFMSGSGDMPEGRALVAWAARRKLSLKRVRDVGGIVIEGNLDGRPWRLEWGPSQRHYISGQELRIRADLGLASGLQMLVLNRSLAERLEQDAYNTFTEDTRTQIELSLPEEARWLAMYKRVELESLLRFRYLALSPELELVRRWVEGGLSNQLLEFAQHGAILDEPIVLMTLRRRLYLRMQALVADEQVLDQAYALFEVAARRAIEISNDLGHETEPSSDDGTAWAPLPPDTRSSG